MKNPTRERTTFNELNTKNITIENLSNKIAAQSPENIIKIFGEEQSPLQAQTKFNIGEEYKNLIWN